MADRAKGVFISNISHELRSPLHGILASAEFISDTRLDTLQRTFVETIDSCGRTLLEVINNVLDFGKLTYIARLNNKIPCPDIQPSTSSDVVPTVQILDPAPLDLMAITEQVVESCYAGYEFKGLFDQVDIGSILGEAGQKAVADIRPRGHTGYGRTKGRASALTVIIDIDYRQQGWFFSLQSGALQRLLMNITGNALKYTSTGWVRVQLFAAEEEGRTMLHLTVSDSGKGISADFLKNRLFSPFSQEDTMQDGTGLGLSIAKQVVESLGGRINVKSQVGVGTQVFVQLPATPKAKPAETDGYLRVRQLTAGLKVFLACFDRQVPASRLLHESMSKYLVTWYGMQLVDDVYSSDIIISDECPELIDYFRQGAPSEKSAFAMAASKDILPKDSLPTPDSEGSPHNVYRAWQPLIVLCSNALRYEIFGQQADAGKIIDFSSKPCGPIKLAKSLQFCLEQAENRRKSLEEIMSPAISSPRLPLFSESGPLQSPTTGSTFASGQDLNSPNSFGHGVVRISPSIRRGSTDHWARMYLPGRGFVAAPTSSIVEPEQFPGVRRKSGVSPQISRKSEDERPKWSHLDNGNGPTPRIPPIVIHSPPTEVDQKVAPDELATNSRPGSPYNRCNPPGSVPTADSNNTRKDIIALKSPIGTQRCRPPNVLIVEDNVVNALILATFLKKRGFPFNKVENGLLAVQAVHSRPEGFDVILMDIQSPNPHPLSISKFFRANEMLTLASARDGRKRSNMRHSCN